MGSKYEIRLADLIDRKPTRIEIDGQPICVAKIGNEVFAVSDNCTHADIPLSEGEIVGYDIECWLHGSRFNLRTGVPDSPPAVKPLSTYPVNIVGEIAVIERKK